MSEEVKLFPCPACGGDADFSNMHTEKDATEVWNSIPRALTWTTEPPKVPGKYFRRYRYDDVWEETSDVIIIDSRVYHRNEDVQWAGPIPTPQEPTE